MSIEIRPAEERDASLIAWVQVAAARSHMPVGFLDLAFPGDDEGRLELVERVTKTQTLSMCHWSGFLVAELDGQPGAALSGYEPTKRGTDTFAAAMEEGLTGAGWTAEDLEAMWGRMMPFLKCASESPDDVWVVEWVATKPEFRGNGLVRKLLDAILEEGRSRDYKRAQISFLIGNHPAQRAYEGAGFKVIDEKRHPEFEMALGCPGVSRMMRDL